MTSAFSVIEKDKSFDPMTSLVTDLALCLPHASEEIESILHRDGI
tara:strand:- start:71 stop:205 length:135 start_codon:yes stop_codon:yes gene_type:complete